jgi:urease accessory protein
MRKLSLARVLVTALSITPAIVFAHTGMGDVHDLLHGFMHPIGGLDHVLAMVAVGVLAAQLGGRALWFVPTSFVATMAVAGACAMSGRALPYTEFGIALSLVVLGAVVAFSVKLPIAIAAALVAFFAAFHGYAHGMEMPDTLSGIAFGFGFILATALLHGVGIGLGLGVERIEKENGRRIVLAGGGATALVGLTALASSFVG